MRNFTSPAFYQLFITVAVLALYWFYGQTHFYRDPGSVFFDSEHAYERRYSLLREAEATELLAKLSSGDQKALDGVRVPASKDGAKRDVEMCIGMGTARRDVEKQYVDLALAGLLDGLTLDERSSVHISLLFADVNAVDHPTWNQPWLNTIVEDIWTYDNYKEKIDAGKLQWIKDISNKHDIHTKSIMDYSLILERCLDQTDAPYIAIFEDDTLAARGWVAPTLLALRSADGFISSKSLLFSKTSSKDWLDVRLFNQERSTGWASRSIGGNHEFYIVFALDTLFIGMYFLFRRRSAILQRYTDIWSLIVLCLVALPAIIILFFQSGKASLLPPRPGLHLENFGCCSQALIFNRRQVPGLIGHLRNSLDAQSKGVEDVQYDMRTRDYAFAQGLERLALYPMQVQHIGTHSAAGSASAEARAVWSVAFEDLSPGVLARKHDRAVEELYGIQ